MGIKLKIIDFICHVNDWLNKGSNRVLLDYHRLCCRVMTPDAFLNEIKNFLAMRLLQGEGIKREDIPKGYLGKAAKFYIDDIL